MTAVFLDTVGLIAIWDTTDQWHAQAASVFSKLLYDNTPLVTTSYVLLECGNTAARRPYRGRVNQMRVQLRDAGLLVDPSPEEIDLAWQSYDRGKPGDAGIVDHISFVVMRRLGIRQAFTNDRHFTAAGFETLF